MTFATSYVIAFTNNQSLRTDNDRPYHWIRLGILPTISCQLQTALHEFLVFFNLIHGAKIHFFYYLANI